MTNILFVHAEAVGCLATVDMDNNRGCSHQFPQNDREERYNAAHQKARHPVERCIGILKSRFRCLCRQRILMYSPAKAGRIIIACAVLHNIMLSHNIALPPDEEGDHDVAENEVVFEENGDVDENAIDARTRMINTYF